jgi:drug/metabolite transporter (DMT)-like permease
MNAFQYITLIGSVISVAIADVFLKRASVGALVFKDILKSPWFFAAVILYLVQIFAFCYLFLSGDKLSLVGLTQIILYALVIIVSSVAFFHESISLVQGIGIGLAIIGIILINIK